MPRVMSEKILFVGGEAVEPLTLSAIATRCLTSKRTAARWLASGKLKPAYTVHDRSYFTVKDLTQMRAEALEGMREELKRLTPDELDRLTNALTTAAAQMSAANRKYLR